MSIQVKLFEVRDSMTAISAIGIRINDLFGIRELRDLQIVRHAGYGNDSCVLFGRLQGGQFSYDNYDWGGRTMQVAHDHVSHYWDELESGDIIDVQFILGETDSKCETDFGVY